MTRRENRGNGDQRSAHPDATAGNDRVADTGGRWRLRNWRLRTKLLAVLLIPVLAVLGLLGVRVHSDASRADDFRATAARLDVTKELYSLTGALRDERDLSVRYVAGGRDGELDGLDAARSDADTAAGEFDRALSRVRSELAQDTVDRFNRGHRLSRGLNVLRYRAEHGDATAAEVGDDYTDLVAALRDVNTGAVAKSGDGRLARSELAVTALDKLAEQHSASRRILSASLAEGKLSGQRAQALGAAKAKASAAYEDFRSFASTSQGRQYAAAMQGDAVDQRDETLTAALRLSPSESFPGDITAAGWHEAATETLDRLTTLRGDLHAQLTSRADTLRDHARTALLVDLGLLIGVLLIAGALAIVITRSLLRQMRTLRRSALEVAEERLPAAVHGILTDSDVWPDPGQWQRNLEPVPVSGRDELGQIARAFDAVHGEAVRLAGEQAMLRENVNSMFVNLSRRSQDLVERQLNALDRMEEHEQDPETLGGLFELDHLATRMRRNSENLLVLSGQELDYPVEGSVAAEEVVGAALSEVEQYQRVRVQASPEPSVPAEVAGDLVHVLSELLENATAYSPEDTEVSLSSRLDECGAWLLDVTDWGAGMPEVELRRVNRRLAEPPEVDVEVSRRMGLYVVARLSARHGFDVRLASASTGGLCASVTVPDELVTPIVPEAPSPGVTSENTLQLAGGIEWPIQAPVAAVADPVRPRARQGAEHGSPEYEGGPEEGGSEDESSAGDGADQHHREHDGPGQGVGERDRAAFETAVEPASGNPEAVAAWPTEDRDVSPLVAETPTERLPAYRDVLAEWFRPGEDGKLDDLKLVRSDDATATGWITAWPASADAVWIEPGRTITDDGVHVETLPKRVPRSDRVPSAADTPAMDDGSDATDVHPVETDDAPTLDEQLGLTM